MNLRHLKPKVLLLNHKSQLLNVQQEVEVKHAFSMSKITKVLDNANKEDIKLLKGALEWRYQKAISKQNSNQWL